MGSVAVLAAGLFISVSSQAAEVEQQEVEDVALEQGEQDDGAADRSQGGDEEEQAETREVVDLELKIAAEGRAIGQIVRLVELDTSTSLALTADGHEHAVELRVAKADEQGKTLAVTLGYQVDGEAVMQSMTIEAAAKKAKIVRSEEGKVALSLKMAPKVVSVEELPPPSRKRIEFDEDTDDPLAGL